MNILLPQTGLYKLMIYLEPESASEEKIYVVSYLLECIKPFSQRLVFQNYGDKLGLQSMRKSKFVSEYYSDLQGSHKQGRSEEHTSELQSRETISYAVFCLKKKKKNIPSSTIITIPLIFSSVFSSTTFSNVLVF